MEINFMQEIHCLKIESKDEIVSTPHPCVKYKVIAVYFPSKLFEHNHEHNHENSIHKIKLY